MRPSDLKTAERQRRLALRAALSEEERIARDRLLCRALLRFLSAETPPSAVLTYAAVRGEIDLSPVTVACLERGIRVAYPVSYGGGLMRFYEITSLSELVKGRYGIPEPPETRLAVPDGDALCLVPALAFDRDGFRLGYGGGYYDRFLADFGGRTVGIAGRAGLSDEPLPRGALDRSVGYLATEDGVVRVVSPDRTGAI